MAVAASLSEAFPDQDRTILDQIEDEIGQIFADDTAPDPIDLIVLALDRLAAAVFRTGFTGKPSIVSAPDQQTADLFAAALHQTATRRPTDKLIAIVVEADRTPKSGALS